MKNSPSDFQILIVEDDDLSSQILQEYLKDFGFIVYIATDGQKGFFKMKDVIPDLIFLDIMMPRLDGYQFLTKMSENNIHIPTIMTTALGDANSVKKALKAGAKDYLVKPFELSDVKAKIEHLLSISISAENAVAEDFSFDIDNVGNIFTIRIEGTLSSGAARTVNSALVEQAEEMFSGRIKVLVDIRDINVSSITNDNIGVLLDFYKDIKGLDSADHVKFVSTDSEVNKKLQKHPIAEYFEIVRNKLTGIEKLKL